MVNYQVIDIDKSSGVDAADSNEQTRRWTEKQKEVRSGNPHLNYDFTRTHLDFEIVDGEITNLNPNEQVNDSIRKVFEKKGIPFPGTTKSHRKKGEPEPKKMERIIAARMILGGSPERMNEIAFGSQKPSLKRNADNSHIVRTAAIEEWAKDEYRWLQKTFGKDNIARFIVHLDETNPHIHATIVPTGIIKGKERLSWNSVFGDRELPGPEKFKYFRDSHYEDVGKKWGLERGLPKAITGNKHKSTKEYYAELEQRCLELSYINENLQEDNQQLSQANYQLRDENISLRLSNEDMTAKHEQLQHLCTVAEEDLRKGSKAMKSLTTMIENKMQQRSVVQLDLQQATHQLESGEITPEQYERIAHDAFAKVEEFDAFIATKATKLAEISERMDEHRQIIQEAAEAKAFKEKEPNLLRRLKESKAIKKATDDLRSIAIRLGADENVVKDENIQQLAIRFGRLATDLSEAMEKELMAAKKEGFIAGRDAAMQEISIASGRNWQADKMPTPQTLGKCYNYAYEGNQSLTRFAKEHEGKSVWQYIQEQDDKFRQQSNMAARLQKKIASQNNLLPALQPAIKAIQAMFGVRTGKPVLTMEQAESIWRILSTASTKEECRSMADQLISIAKDDYNSTLVGGHILDDAAECVFAVMENINPLAAIFALTPDGASVGGGGGGGSNDLPRGKDDDENFRRAKFNQIMPTPRSGGRKR